MWKENVNCTGVFGKNTDAFSVRKWLAKRAALCYSYADKIWI